MGRKIMKHSIENLVLTRFRTLFLLCCGCTTFFLLHNAFGGLRAPSAGPADSFPRKIWQSWKLDPLRFEARDAERAMTWTLKNPSYRYEVLTDDNAMTYVEEHFGFHGFNRPDIVSIYKDLNARIIQADLLRYLIMYVEGGVWADIDVQALQPIDHFIPKRHHERDLDMIVGIETDEPSLKDHPVLGSKAQSFCQWTFQCKPRLPVMMRLIDNILIWLSNLAIQQAKPISELELSFDEVLNGTGPSAFTTAILAEMSAATGYRTTWADFHDLEESKVVGGVLVLTSEAFAAGTGHSRSGNHHGKGALVKHHFHASAWTTHHPRFKHPIYGEVERCNWDVECVKLWDANTAFFAALPKEDQRKMIGLKEQEDATAASSFEPVAEDLQVPDLALPPNEPLGEPAVEHIDNSGLDLPPNEPLSEPAIDRIDQDIMLAEAAPVEIVAGLPAGLPSAEILAGLAPGLAVGLQQIDLPLTEDSSAATPDTDGIPAAISAPDLAPVSEQLPVEILEVPPEEPLAA